MRVLGVMEHRAYRSPRLTWSMTGTNLSPPNHRQSRMALGSSIVTVNTHRALSLASAALPSWFLGFSCTDFS